MDNLETIMQDKRLVSEAVKKLLVDIYCPSDFRLKNLAKCKTKKIHYYCGKCWNQALKNQE